MARYSWMAPEPARMGALMDPAKIRMGRPQFRTPGSLGALPPVGALAGSGSGTGSGGGSGAGSGAGEAAGEGSSDAGLIDDLLGGLIPSIPSSGGDEGPTGGTGSGVLDPPPPTTTGGGGGSVGDAPTGINPLAQPELDAVWAEFIKDNPAYAGVTGEMKQTILDWLKDIGADVVYSPEGGVSAGGGSPGAPSPGGGVIGGGSATRIPASGTYREPADIGAFYDRLLSPTTTGTTGYGPWQPSSGGPWLGVLLE